MEPLALMTEDMKEDFQKIPSQMRHDSRLVGLKQEDLENWLTPAGRVAKNTVFMDAVRHDMSVLDPEHPLDDKTVTHYANRISDYAKLEYSLWENTKNLLTHYGDKKPWNCLIFGSLEKH